MVTGTGTTAARGDWWLRMSTERRAREKALFQKLVTHFYLVSGDRAREGRRGQNSREFIKAP